MGRLFRVEDGGEMLEDLKFIKFIPADTQSHSVGNKYRWLYITQSSDGTGGKEMSLTQIYCYYSLWENHEVSLSWWRIPEF